MTWQKKTKFVTPEEYNRPDWSSHSVRCPVCHFEHDAESNAAAEKLVREFETELKRQAQLTARDKKRKLDDEHFYCGLIVSLTVLIGTGYEQPAEEILKCVDPVACLETARKNNQQEVAHFIQQFIDREKKKK